MSIAIDTTAGSLESATQAAERMRDDLRIGGEPGISRGHEVGEAGGFGAIFEKTVLTASAREHDAIHKADALAAGRSDDLHGTMITMKEAEISMKLVGSVRDKLMDAFHELWRINV